MCLRLNRRMDRLVNAPSTLGNMQSQAVAWHTFLRRIHRIDNKLRQHGCQRVKT